ncbi:hypothetical protein KM043_003501 [Ampulex compressa]|nr:hypothetical protein KM043_003501 [Ampulex compressa]
MDKPGNSIEARREEDEERIEEDIDDRGEKEGVRNAVAVEQSQRPAGSMLAALCNPPDRAVVAPAATPYDGHPRRLWQRHDRMPAWNNLSYPASNQCGLRAGLWRGMAINEPR